ncbi:DUF3899 domain-containing protein [Ligilactobacillus ceti]|uniref:DUF3899 domain-containing protein n=1 Tax=Ligilactobacillus ceti DSM 22408 TaxID=1122146 RepID=A0A0R2KT41_9LACO|nr:DUF3899 domain-containing protein [Ligilactobacillus ceti]KRN89421.1 hypothetical protein IV53_GL000139 [Ligilactobacillus ceti DSM 22408]
MNFIKEKIWPKFTGGIVLAVIIISFGSVIFHYQRVVSDGFFIAGMVCLLAAIVNILAHAQLFAGFFKRKKKGETDEEYQANKLKVREIGSKKNAPIHFDKFALNMLILAVVLILAAILITL